MCCSTVAVRSAFTWAETQQEKSNNKSRLSFSLTCAFGRRLAQKMLQITDVMCCFESVSLLQLLSMKLLSVPPLTLMQNVLNYDKGNVET